MRKLLLLLLLLPIATAEAQEPLVVQCRVGDDVLESWYEPATALGQPGEKVLPLHLVLTRAGDYLVEFRSDRPFTMYAYRYDADGRQWQFLESSAPARDVTDQAGDRHRQWQMRIDKTEPVVHDYLFQAQPAAEAQSVRHKYQFIQRTRHCG